MSAVIKDTNKPSYKQCYFVAISSTSTIFNETPAYSIIYCKCMTIYLSIQKMTKHHKYCSPCMNWQSKTNTLK